MVTSGAGGRSNGYDEPRRWGGQGRMKTLAAAGEKSRLVSWRRTVCHWQR